MTADERWNKLRERFSKPKFIVLTAAVTGLLIIAASSTYAFMPALREQLDSARELWVVRQQKAALDRTPIPEPYNPDTAMPWLKKVPVKEDHSEVIQSLLELEARSGAKIVHITFDEEVKEVDELTRLMQSLRKPVNAQDDSNAVMEAEPEVTEEGFIVQPLNVSATGSYEQIREFWMGLQQLERLTMTKDWNIKALTDGTVDFTVTMSIFTAPDFSDVLPEPETSILTAPPLERESPALSEEQFLELLQPENN